jgi:ABC-type antimicrobial peptide transport system permease subunit
MWRNYLKIAIRNSIRDKYYIIINVFGLGIAMAFGLTIYLFHAYNLEFDDYYQDTDNIVRLHCLKPDAQGQKERFEMSPIPMAQRVARELAGVDDFTRFMVWGDNLKHEDQVFNTTIGYVDPNFFEFFPIKLKSGIAEDIKQKNSIFLTSETAKKYFGDADPVGEIMTIYYSTDRSVDVTVAGVFERVPFNSSFIFEALVQVDNFLYGQNIAEDDWSPWQQATAFFKIASMENLDELNNGIKKYVAIQNDAREEWKVSDYQLVGFKDADMLEQGFVVGTHTGMRLRLEVLMVFTVLALLILLIVSFNMANTAMALMTRRFKEIGVRKAMGGGARHIFTQFMFEMSWTSFLGLIMGAALFHWVSQGFFAIWDIPYLASDVSSLRLIGAFIGLFLLAAIFSGLSPAFYSRRLQPTSIFKKHLKFKQTNWTSRILISLQFAISLTLIIAGIIFTRNAEFIRMLDIGYDKERLITIWVENDTEYRNLKDKIASLSSVSRMAGTTDHFGWNYQDSYVALDTGKVEVRTLHVGRDYLQVMDVKLKEGRFFDFEKASDTLENVIINEAYAQKFQVDNPLGKTINLEGNKKYIIGVTKNIIDHVYQEYEPIPKVLLAAPEEKYKSIIVKTQPNQEEEAFTALEKSWKSLIPDRPFTGRFQDDIALGYALQDNNNLKTIFYYMAILGGILSVSGIFALSSLNVSRRIKEIGIRKVMGASTQNIILLMNKEFSIIIGISLVLGSIMGTFLTGQLLDFIYKFHIDVGFWPVAFGALLIAIVALLTTSSTILQAAQTNPSETLRDE